MDNCAGCHGERGDGWGPRGPYMRPPAFDLRGYQLSPTLIWNAVLNGVPGTEMPSWKTLPDLDAVVSYVEGLGQAGGLSPEQRLAPPEVLLEAGRRVYTTHCVRCHGERGDGRGPEASRYTPPPADFADLKPSYDSARLAIYGGVAGTAMPPWPLLTEAEVQAVTCYIRSFYRWPSPDAAAGRQPAKVDGAPSSKSISSNATQKEQLP